MAHFMYRANIANDRARWVGETKLNCNFCDKHRTSFAKDSQCYQCWVENNQKGLARTDEDSTALLKEDLA